MIRTLIFHRKFIWARALADLGNRYAGTGFGITWNVLQPVFLIGMYALVFSAVMPVRLGSGSGGSLDYTFYLCSGFLPWMAFCDCIVRGCNAFVANAGYLKKLPVPEHIFVAEGAASSFISLLVSFSMLLVLMVITGFTPSLTWLLIPVGLAALLALGFSVGVFFGTLNVFFRDVSQFLSIALQLMMWSLPIVYVPSVLPEGWLRSLLPWHPVLPAISFIRETTLNGTVPVPEIWIAMTFWSALMFVVAWAVLRKLGPEIRDVI